MARTAVKRDKKVVVAMSGGVDSSVAALLLKRKKCELTGLFLKFWSEDSNNSCENRCCGNDSLKRASYVCEQLGIKLIKLDVRELFKKKVVDPFIKSYERGHTPNPCVECNREIKFGHLLKVVRELGYDYLATGHYVRRGKSSDLRYKILKAKDRSKDQSYFLYTLRQKSLERILFPLGGYLKSEVKIIAEKRGFPVKGLRESQEVCFVPEKTPNNFLKRHSKMKVGKIINIGGEVMGRHSGLPLYTLGQRKGVEIGGAGPFYVYEKKIRNNELVVVGRKDLDKLYSPILYADKLCWISGAEPKYPLECRAQTRYRQKACKASVRKISNNKVEVAFSIPQRAVTPGQSVVFYQGEQLLGGGIIRGSLPNT